MKYQRNNLNNIFNYKILNLKCIKNNIIVIYISVEIIVVEYITSINQIDLFNKMVIIHKEFHMVVFIKVKIFLHNNIIFLRKKFL